MEKRVTAQDVAKEAGVSPTTVSFVLNNVEGVNIREDTRARVLEAAKNLNYHPNSSAQKMARGKTYVIGLILRQNTDQAYADLFLPQVMEGISFITRQNGYQILFFPLPPEEKEEGFLKLIHERHVDGLIVSGPTEDDRILDDLYKNGTAIVLLGQMKGSPIPYADIDNLNAAAKAVRHLVNSGHKRIGFISNAPLTYTSSSARLEGYKQVLEESGLAYDENLVQIADRTPQEGYQAMSAMLQADPLPSAVFVASDTVAVGCLHALSEKGLRIPDDMAIIGFDDIPISKFLNPSLSTIHLPAFSLGQAAAGLLIQQLENGTNIQEEIILKNKLIIRDSTIKTTQKKEVPGE